MVRRFILVSVIVLMISGCSTSLVKYEDSNPVPSERIYKPYVQYSEATKSSATLIVVRDGGILGGAGSAALFVNGEIVARLKLSESLVLHIPAGDNVIGAGPGTKLNWESDTVGLEEQTLLAVEGEEYFYRLSVDPYRGLVLNRSTQLSKEKLELDSN